MSATNTTSVAATSTNNTADTNPPPPTKCHLLTIPPELRLIIYEQVLLSHTYTRTTPEKPYARPPLLSVSRLIRNEALLTYRFCLENALARLMTAMDIAQDDHKIAKAYARAGGSVGMQMATGQGEGKLRVRVMTTQALVEAEVKWTKNLEML